MHRTWHSWRGVDKRDLQRELRKGNIRYRDVRTLGRYSEIKTSYGALDATFSPWYAQLESPHDERTLKDYSNRLLEISGGFYPYRIPNPVMLAPAVIFISSGLISAALYNAGINYWIISTAAGAVAALACYRYLQTRGRYWRD